ncbi:MAG: hypothetical protein QM778_33155 [Myxococcales bacterium]
MVDRAAFVIGPRAAADTTGLKGVERLASAGPTLNTDTIHVTLSALSTVVTQGKQGTGPFVFIQPVGCDLQYSYSKGQQDITWNQNHGSGHRRRARRPDHS